MADHYFTDDTNLADDPHTLTYYNDKKDLIFETNSGMFSKEKLDYFSIVLIDTIIEEELENINSYLDLGCGYGFIGITLSLIYPDAKKYFIDITSRAVEYTKINIQKNKVSDAHVIKSDGITIDNKFDLITLNPPVHAGKEVMYSLYLQARDHLSNDGVFYIVLHKKHGALSTIKDMQDEFSSIDVVYKKKGLFVIKFKK